MLILTVGMAKKILRVIIHAMKQFDCKLSKINKISGDLE